MKKAIMVSPKTIKFEEVDIPEIRDNEILVQNKRIGICGSDIHVYHGKHPFTSYPIVQGHEVCGEVVKTGADVSDFETGDLITIMPQIFCGECYMCRTGHYNICEKLKVLGFQADGVASEYFVADPNMTLKLNDSISFNKAAMIEPVAVAVRAVKQLKKISGRKIVVLGAGTIGNLIGQTAKAMGAENVLIADLSDFRLEKAIECGIDYSVNLKTIKLEDAINKYFGEDKADAIFDCAGADATIHSAIESARKGSEIVIVAVFSKKPEIDLGLIQDRELKLYGTLMYVKEDFEKAIELIDNKKIFPEKIITKEFSFSEYSKAYEYIDENGDSSMKIIINME